MQILRARDGAATPWSNGGGVTREVALSPPGTGSAAFDWRISIATVSRGGPFSVFPGVDRELAVLKGMLTLSIQGQDETSLGPQSPAIHFPGDVPTSGDPRGGPVTDLNVMTRRGRYSSRMTRIVIQGRHVQAQRVAISFLVALAPARILRRGHEHELKPHDTVRFDAADGEVIVSAQSTACVLVEILATPAP
jgi:environmental stress-induced protein Ves